ncbi:hypothetical protein NKG94_43800 [Micromonospora sp. M12]
MGYRRGNFRRETVISSSMSARYDDKGFAYTVHLEPNEQWEASIDVQTQAVGPGGRDLRFGLRVHGNERLALEHDLEKWIADAPKVNSEHGRVAATYRRSLIDLAALRFSPLSLGGATLPAAGLPWFMTMFGRDSILTCLQTLPFTPQLSKTTLRVLASCRAAGSTTSGTGPGAHPARDALRRNRRLRGAAALAVLRLGGRHTAVRRAARRVRAVDRGRGAGQGVGAGVPGGAEVDRQLRRPGR